jgi:hypothetical protein
LLGLGVPNRYKPSAGPVKNSICISPLRDDSCYGTRISGIPVAGLVAVAQSSPARMRGPDAARDFGMADWPTWLRTDSEQAPLQSEI